MGAALFGLLRIGRAAPVSSRYGHGMPWLGLCLAAIAVQAGCAAPMQRQVAAATAPAGLKAQRPVATTAGRGRPVVGVAFGGGSAKGIAHVGVIRWLAEHRIPIDVASGTSMGGLIGGAFATGMDADELERMLAAIDWDEMFGSSSFAYKNIRRKADARAYPSRLEFGVKRGIVPPAALNNGEQVDLLLSRITAPYAGLQDFDRLPTPFRVVAVDLVTASEVVLDHGSLPRALRATMSLPLIFPPVDMDGRVLVDGGMMNNVPADVARAMGADRVIAINVGDLSDQPGISYTLFGLAGSTLDAMMRASTKAVIASADVVVNVPLAKKYGSLDWRRGPDLIREGYQAAEAMRDVLLPLAVSEQEYERWSRERQQRRLHALPRPAFVGVEGFSPSDARRLDEVLASYAGRTLDVERLEADLAPFSGLDRYQTITWRMVTNDDGKSGLLVVGQPKPYGPPFLMLGLNLENTTSSDFGVSLSARYLTYGVVGSGSELRVDGTIGSNPAAAIELYEPIGRTPLFATAFADITSDSTSFLSDDEIVARYEGTRSRLGFTVGRNLGRMSDVRVGAYIGHVDAHVAIGNPGLPDLRGNESGLLAVWRMDGQDSSVVPSRGLSAMASALHLLHTPEGVIDDQTFPVDAATTLLSATGSRFWSFGVSNRLFAYGGIGTAFEGDALPTNQFTLGSPLRLGAYRDGELRGNHYYIGTAGYLRRIARLPDFLGGNVYAGGWLENGDAFDEWAAAGFRTNASTGIIADTLLGPVMVGGSAGFDGRWRTYVGIGRLFR